MFDLTNGDIVTVILRSGIQLTGPYQSYDDTSVMVDGWVVSTEMIQAWKPGTWE